MIKEALIKKLEGDVAAAEADLRVFLADPKGVAEHIDFVDIITDDTNYKDQLLRWFQAQYHQPPR